MDWFSSIGPYSLLFNKSGSFKVSGKLVARSNLKLFIDGGAVEILGNLFINNDVSINCMKKITIGKGCLIGENVKIYDHDHAYKHGVPYSETGFITKEITIGNNVWIGSNVIILKGVTIGDNVVIAAGSTIHKSIPSNVLYYENKKIECRI